VTGAEPAKASEGDGTRRARIGSAIHTPPTVAEPAVEPTTEPAGAQAPPVSAPPSSPPEAAGADGPSRDELTLAWADQLLPRLSRQAKPVLAAGRWVDTDAGVVLAVPNEPHRTRCEQHRTELEGALSAHFGRPVTVRFVVEGSLTGSVTGVGRERGGSGPGDRTTPGSPSAPGRGEPDPGPDPDESIDPAELIDAGPEHDLAPLERLAQAFPGAELVDEG
jgi:DNA polymerase-3 subunit gamma/tau